MIQIVKRLLISLFFGAFTTVVLGSFGFPSDTICVLFYTHILLLIFTLDFIIKSKFSEQTKALWCALSFLLPIYGSIAFLHLIDNQKESESQKDLL